VRSRQIRIWLVLIAVLIVAVLVNLVIHAGWLVCDVQVA
jgi:hypothetical protein